MQEIRFDKIFTGSEWIRDKSIVIEDGRIAKIAPGDGVGAQMGFLCAGFIDLQLYGGGGKLFSNQVTTECITSTFEEHIKTGTVAFQITLNCSPKIPCHKRSKLVKIIKGKDL